MEHNELARGGYDVIWYEFSPKSVFTITAHFALELRHHHWLTCSCMSYQGTSWRWLKSHSLIMANGCSRHRETDSGLSTRPTKVATKEQVTYVPHIILRTNFFSSISLTLSLDRQQVHPPHTSRGAWAHYLVSYCTSHFLLIGTWIAFNFIFPNFVVILNLIIMSF